MNSRLQAAARALVVAAAYDDKCYTIDGSSRSELHAPEYAVLLKNMCIRWFRRARPARIVTSGVSRECTDNLRRTALNLSLMRC